MPPAESEFLYGFYDEYPRIEEAFQAALDESLNPRGQELPYETVAGLGLPAGASAVDLGCGEGAHSIRLAERFGFQVLGIDPVRRHVELSNEALDAGCERNPNLRDLVRFELGTAEAIPVADVSVDLIWCREVLVHVEVLEKAFAECRRVLRAGGRMLIYQNFATDRLDPREWVLESGEPSNSPERMETAIAGAGLQTDECIVLGSEIGERLEEDSGQGSRRLIHVARLLRAPERYIAQFGQQNYDIMLADCLWHVYRLLGKLSGRIYVLSSP